MGPCAKPKACHKVSNPRVAAEGEGTRSAGWGTAALACHPQAPSSPLPCSLPVMYSHSLRSHPLVGVVPEVATRPPNGAAPHCTPTYPNLWTVETSFRSVRSAFGQLHLSSPSTAFGHPAYAWAYVRTCVFADAWVPFHGFWRLHRVKQPASTPTQTPPRELANPGPGGRQMGSHMR